jgi:hypothetical protein
VSLLLLAAPSCGQKPKAPTEDEARAAFEARQGLLTKLDEALDKGLRDAGLDKARPACASGEQSCLELLRKRDAEIATAQKSLAQVLSSSDIACAEVSVSTPSHGEELAWRVAACPTGRRGDSIEPAQGTKLGDYQLGRGVYFKDDRAMRRGIAVRRETKRGEATLALEIYFFIDT